MRIAKSGRRLQELLNATPRRDPADPTRLIDTANAPIFEANLEGRVTEWNAKAAALSGYSKDETIGQPLVEKFITEEYKEQVRKVLGT